MNNRNFAERNNHGAYRQNMDDHDIRRQSYGSSEEYAHSSAPVTTVTSYASGHRSSTELGLSGMTSEFYDDNSWVGRDERREISAPVVPDRNNTRGHNFDEKRRLSLTNLAGPLGTSGRTPRRMDSIQYSQLLKEGYSTGLALALSENATRYDFRFWVVDNSGSMQIGDGHRIVKKEGKSKAVACTRWEEIKETVKYHAQMASTLDCPTIFQLLNDPGLRTAPQKFSVCENGQANAQSDVAKSIEIMRKVSPSGVTPLTQHIWNVREHIAGMAAELRRTGKIVAIILATDGLPTDELGYGGEDITEEVSDFCCLLFLSNYNHPLCDLYDRLESAVY